MSLFGECKQEIQHLTEEIKDLHNDTFPFMKRIQNLNSWSFDGLEIKTELGNINKKLKQLILRVKYKAEELETLSERGVFTEQQADEIKEVWYLMLAKLQSTNSVINDTIDTLRSQNLIADIVSFIEELWASIEMVIKVATKVVIQGFAIMFLEGRNNQKLPPSDKS